ncbi:MAG: hypothetical protein ACFCUN_09365 [Hyphomicrobiaceae bacterium]
MNAIQTLLSDDDDSLYALGIMLSAWEEGTDSGVSSRTLAYAALFTALTDLVTEFGEEPVAILVKGLEERVRSGEFTLWTSLQ